jgi:hypothetical protein
LVYDSEKIAKELGENVDYGKMMQSSMKLGNKMQFVLVDFLRAADAKFNLLQER